MLKKRASIIANALFLIVAVWFYVASYSIKGEATATYASPTYYPRLLSGLMILFSLISLYRDIFGDLRRVDKVIPLPHKKNAVAIFAAMVLFVLGWRFTRMPYLWMFVLLVFVLLIIGGESVTRKRLILSVVISAIFSAAMYVVFDILFSIHL